MTAIVRDSNRGPRLVLGAALALAALGLVAHRTDSGSSQKAAFALAGTAQTTGARAAATEDSFEAELERLHPPATASACGGCCGGMRAGRGSGSGAGSGSGSGSGSGTVQRAGGCGGSCGGGAGTAGMCPAPTRTGSVR